MTAQGLRIFCRMAIEFEGRGLLLTPRRTEPLSSRQSCFAAWPQREMPVPANLR